MEDKWIDSIKDKMAKYEAVPPAGLLESVQAEVKAAKRKKMILFSAAAASIALLVGVSVVLIQDRLDVAVPSIPDLAEAVHEQEFSTKSGEIEPSLIAGISESESRKRVSVSPVSAESDKANDVSDMTERRDDVYVGNNEGDDSHEEDIQNVSSDRSGYSAADRYADAYQPLPGGGHSHKSDVSIGMAASANGLGGLMGDGSLNGQTFHGAASLPLTRMGGGLLGSNSSNGYQEPAFVEIFEHKLPARFSIDFSLPLYHRLSIGSGITYSYLRSDIVYGYSDSKLYRAAQNLHFLGIPVNLIYTPVSFGNLDIYTEVGFMVEKCVGGDIKEEDMSAPPYSYVGSGERPFQFSFKAAAGVQYSLTNGCAVFIEPGIGLYMRNGSRLRTIYTERPVMFNVNVGFRFGRLR